MARGWRQLLDEEVYGRGGRQVGFEKMRKEKRSERGRTVDDWIIKIESNDESRLKVENLIGLGQRRGRVIEVHKRYVFVAEENSAGKPDTGQLWLCSIAKRHFQRAHKERNFVVVGDRILFVPDQDVHFDEAGDVEGTDLPRGTVQHAFERHSRIARQDPLNPQWDHVMLANVDLVCIVASVLHPEVRWGLIDRLLVQAEIEDLRPVIILNKVDLLENTKIASPEFLDKYNKRVNIYRKIGYEVIEVCALKPQRTIESVKALRELFRNKLVGFCGHSGVGKSSILNLMQPEFEQVVDDNPDIFYKGRHTTTYNSLLQLGIGAYAIDTPGVRSFSIAEMDAPTLSACFPEFANLRCKYRECAHDGEPDCAIKAKVKEGEISEERYRSYLGILKGQSFREGEGDSTDAAMIADLKARAQQRDEELNAAESDENISGTDSKAKKALTTPSVMQILNPTNPENSKPSKGGRALRSLLARRSAATPTPTEE